MCALVWCCLTTEGEGGYTGGALCYNGRSIVAAAGIADPVIGCVSVCWPIVLVQDHS